MVLDPGGKQSLTKHHGKPRRYPPLPRVYKTAPSVYRKFAQITVEEPYMAHKKIERQKELQRKRKRRMERLKQRVRDAKAAKA